MHNTRARHLLGRFVAVINDVTANIDPSEVSAPLDRGISALRKLNIQESRTPRFVEDIATGRMQSNAVDQKAASTDGSLQVDHSSIFTPSSAEGMDEEYSPYSVLNSILWGAGDAHKAPGYPGGLL